MTDHKVFKVCKKAPVPGPDYVSQYNPADGPFTTEKPTAESKIQYANKGFAARHKNGGLPVITVPHVLKLAAKGHGDKPALCVEYPVPQLVGGRAPPSAPREEWKTWTYNEFYKDACRLAKGCLSLGHNQHEAVAIFGFNSPEWVISQYGGMMAGGKATGIYPSDTPAQLAFKIKHSNASIALCQGEGEMKKFQEVVDEMPCLNAIVCWAADAGVTSLDRADGSKIKVLTFNQLLELGDKVDDKVLEAREALIKPTHCCTVVYTSGTTGNPKGVMLSHDNLNFESALVWTHLPFMGAKMEQERVLSYLPLSHAAGMLHDVTYPTSITAFKVGWVTTYFARPYDLKAGTLKDRLQAVRPTQFLGVPRVWEKISEKIKAIGAQTKGAKKKIAVWAKSKGMKYQNSLQLGGNGAKPSMFALAEKLVLSKVKDNLGLDKCKFALSGAAPLTKDTLEFFGALGININECYGMSESFAAVTCASDPCHQWGTIGFAAPGCDVKVFRVDSENINKKTECPKASDIFAPSDAEQGELCFRGRNIMMGYLANPSFGEEHVAEMQKKNAETVDAEGWLHSGDMCAMSTLGMIKITGRYKELIIGAGGENIAPVPIEDEIKKQCPAVANVMMIGDKRKFNVCLITLKAVGASGELPGGDVLDGDAKTLVPGISTISGAIGSAEYAKLLEEAITRTNKNGTVCPSNAAKVQKFMILPIDFSVTTDELTATLKLKRGVVSKKYDAEIERMYASKETYVKYGGVIPAPMPRSMSL